MILKSKDGVVADLLAWDFSVQDQAYALVKLPDCSLSEWKIQDCRVIEERKTSNPSELGATASNTGSLQCFNVACPALWLNHECTSSIGSKCSSRVETQQASA